MGLLSFFFSKKTPEVSSSDIDENNTVSKDLFYEVLDLDSSIIMFFTKDGGWIGANKRFFEYFDYKNIQDFRAKHESIRELFESEDEEVFTEYDKSWLDFIRVNKKEGYKLSILDKDDEHQKFRAKCSILKQAGKDLYVLELENISELDIALKQTQEVEKLKTKFLANIGHEFRTPMNGILGFIDLLEKAGPTAKQSEYLNMTHTSARNLMSNIESLLDLAQMQSGRLVKDSSEFSLIHEIEELSKIYTDQGKDKGIAVSFFIDPKIPTLINGDVRKIKQIIVNLISNALKFTSRGGRVQIEIKLLKRALNSACSIGFSIKDTGQGITKEQLTIITEPFVSGEQADSRLGVGLSLSHGLIKLLGGNLKISSEPKKGSTFSFALSFEKSSDDLINQINGKKAKVVLLDDDKLESANMLTHYLRSFGLHVTKINSIEKNIYEDCDVLYIVASQEQSAWMLKLGTFSKKSKTVLLLENNERLQTRMTHIIDHTLVKPLLPTKISKHLDKLFVTKSETTPQNANEKVRALVVEDNLINQRLIKILLKEYNLNVTTAGDGEQAIQQCASNKFDIIFMDIDMPIKNGIVATKEIKQRNIINEHSMPIIALTALAMQGDRENILGEGLDDYLSKPLTREKLEYILQKHLKMVF